ncbi:MAG: hypothetical protein AAGD11_06190 [Planctomycetota bacterium]
MGHAVEYVVDIPGTSFNALFAPEDRASPEDIRFYRENDAWWEATIPSTNKRIATELTGLATIVILPEKYARYLIDEATKQRVIGWEGVVKRLLPQARIVRLSESLRHDWESQVGEYWFRDAELIEGFYAWIKSQEASAWASL